MHEVSARAEALDHREDVVPAAGIEGRDVVAQLVEDGVHLEGGGDRLDQHRGLDGPSIEAEALLGDHEGVAPQRRLAVGLELRDVEVGTTASVEQLRGVAVHVQAEVHERAGERVAVDAQVALGQVQAAGAHEQHGVLLVEAVLLALLLVLHRAPHRISEVGLADDHVGPGGRVRVLEVGHEAPGAGVERVDDHLAACGAGDLNAAVLEGVRNRRHLEVLGRGDEVERAAGVELGLAFRPCFEQAAAGVVELLVETAHELQGLRGQDLLVALRSAASNLYVV